MGCFQSGSFPGCGWASPTMTELFLGAISAGILLCRAGGAGREENPLSCSLDAPAVYGEEGFQGGSQEGGQTLRYLLGLSSPPSLSPSASLKSRLAWAFPAGFILCPLCPAIPSFKAFKKELSGCLGEWED